LKEEWTYSLEVHEFFEHLDALEDFSIKPRVDYMRTIDSLAIVSDLHARITISLSLGSR
jgi:hypothetical protein